MRGRRKTTRAVGAACGELTLAVSDFGSVTTFFTADLATPFTSLLRTHEPLSPSVNLIIQ